MILRPVKPPVALRSADDGAVVRVDQRYLVSSVSSSDRQDGLDNLLNDGVFQLFITDFRVVLRREDDGINAFYFAGFAIVNRRSVGLFASGTQPLAGGRLCVICFDAASGGGCNRWQTASGSGFRRRHSRTSNLGRQRLGSSQCASCVLVHALGDVRRLLVVKYTLTVRQLVVSKPSSEVL